MTRKIFNPIFFLLISLIGFNCSSQGQVMTDKKILKQYEKAKQLYQARDDQGAMKVLRNILAKSPEFPDAHMLKFQIHQEKGDYELAAKELEEVVRISPNFFPNAHLFLGRIYLSEGKYGEAKERLDYFIKYKSMGQGINTSSSEYFPSLTANDKTFLFTRRLKTENGPEQEDFYISEYVDGSWKMAKPLKFINTPMNEGAPSIAPDGELIVFTACENVYGEYGGGRKGLGSCDLFYSFREGDSWTKPRNIGPSINTRNWETQPSLSADGRTLYFVRAMKKKEGVRNLDIYKSTLGRDGTWSVAEKLSDVINTPKDESSVLIHPDGNTLYFTSDGHLGMGGEDMYFSRKDQDGNWTLPVNLGYPINTYKNENSLVVSTSGDVAYFASDREGGMGGMDLYQFDLYKEAQPVEVNYMEGNVFDMETKKPVQALFQLIDLASGDLVIESYSNAIDGKFLVTLPAGKEYALNVSSPEYLFYSNHFSFTNGSKTEPYILDVPLSKPKSGTSVVLENIFFETGEYTLNEKSFVEIDKLYEFLKNNESLKVEISGHTDNVGSDASNKKLSNDRAEAVKNKLMALGIAGARLSAIGHGSAKPISDNNTENGRAKNRRTEMTIL